MGSSNCRGGECCNEQFTTMFRSRVIRPELLDSADPEEARKNLADLVRINTKFGGHSTIRKLVGTAAKSAEPFSLLDVGAASGDTARVIAQAFPNASITCADYNAVNLSAAPKPKLLADAFRLPFAPRSFDYVLCSLFLHHFNDSAVVELLKGMYNVAKRAVLVCDLERHILPYLFLPATRPLFHWQRITLHDGPVSVRAAFRRRELAGLAKAAGIDDVVTRSHRPAFRITLVGWRRR
jgi:2-polyprenyl-3-methyl-5-hydroxy-6-metoxy-1,4-benzoquinol methylase